MKELIKSIEKLKKTKVKILIDKRIKEFKKIKQRSKHEIFKELCFCILTANFNAEKTIKIQKIIDDGFLVLLEAELAKKLKGLGHRYPNARAKYIVEARRYKDSLKTIIKQFNETELRDLLIKNIKGIGCKETSHFLRNIGYKNSAIIDFHIIDLLVRYKIIKRPKTLTKTKYLEIENKLKEIAKKTNLNLAELDLYLWYIETKKILK